MRIDVLTSITGVEFADAWERKLIRPSVLPPNSIDLKFAKAPMWRISVTCSQWPRW